MDSFKDDKLKSEDVKYLVSTHGSRGGEAGPRPNPKLREWGWGPSH